MDGMAEVCHSGIVVDHHIGTCCPHLRGCLDCTIVKLVNAAGLFVQQASQGSSQQGWRFKGPAVGPAEGSYEV